MVARYEAGRLSAADPCVLEGWGTPGKDALARLKELADAGDAPLATRLAGEVVEQDPEIMTQKRNALKAILPVQPPGATATCDALIDLASDDLIQTWTSSRHGPPPAPPQRMRPCPPAEWWWPIF
jgi:hypothetical protein